MNGLAALALMLGCLAAQDAHAAIYTYDSMGRLATSTDDHGAITTYVYDAAGNRTSVNSTVNTLPTSAPFSFTTAMNTAVGFDPRTSAASPSGYALSVSGAGSPAHGTATFTSTSITYTPTSSYVGRDSFTYSVSDGHGGSATGAVNMTVSPTGPTVGAAYMNAITATTTTSDPRLWDSSPSGLTLYIGSIGAPAHGSASTNTTSVTYTSVAGFTGADTFTYTVFDSAGGSASNTVNVNVTAH